MCRAIAFLVLSEILDILRPNVHLLQYDRLFSTAAIWLRFNIEIVLSCIGLVFEIVLPIEVLRLLYIETVQIPFLAKQEFLFIFKCYIINHPSRFLGADEETLDDKGNKPLCNHNHIFNCSRGDMLWTPEGGIAFNSSSPEQNGRHFADHIFKRIFLS